MSNDTISAKPFLTWPGGKRALLPEIRKHMPSAYNRYFEPFLGGGALFFDTLPSSATLSDRNSSLIECYTEVRDNVDAVIAALSHMPKGRQECS